MTASLAPSIAVAPGVRSPHTWEILNMLTHKQFAAQDFEPTAFGPKFSAAHDDILKAFAIASRVAVAVLEKSKPQLIEVVRALDVAHGEEANKAFLDTLRQGIERAKLLMELITNAEARCMVALANIYKEDGTSSDARGRRRAQQQK
jgi:hypothetical protein